MEFCQPPSQLPEALPSDLRQSYARPRKRAPSDVPTGRNPSESDPAAQEATQTSSVPYPPS